MARLRKATTQDLMRLDAIASHLKVKTRFPHPSFFADVTAASVASMTTEPPRSRSAVPRPRLVS